jgi:hypothetical protein
LLGILVGVVHRLVIQLSQRIPAWLGEAPRVSIPFQGFDGSLRQTASAILNSSAVSVLIATTLVLIFFLLFLALRRRMLAGIAFGGLLVVAAIFENGWSPALGFVLAGIVVQTLTVTRLGLLALIVSLATSRLLEVVPLSVDPGTWAFSATVTLIGLFLASAVYGFRTALAGRPLFDVRLLD